MGNNQPRVSIVLPVFNGDTYLKDALDSILAQTFADFEVVISDNASTDNTSEICQAYARKDNRIRYFNNKKNLGAAKNYNNVFRLSSGEYFKWMAHDDVIEPEFLEKCVHVLDRDPSIVLCSSRVKIINESGKVLGNFDISLNRVSSEKPQDRFKDLILNDVWCMEVFGLIRSSVLKKTRLIDKYIASDRILRAELGLLGRFHEIPEYLSLSRDHPERSVRKMPAHHLRAGWFDPAREGMRVFPLWRVFFEYYRCVWRIPLNAKLRAACLMYLMRWLTVNMNWARMAADIIIAFKPDVWKSFFKIKGGEYWLKVKKE